MSFVKNLTRTSTRYRDTGILLLRIGIGVAFALHGLPKMMGGPPYWQQVGGAMGNLGINFLPSFWGFMAAFAELVGGVLLAIGLFFRPVTFLLAFTMLIALLSHLSRSDEFNGYSHALESMILFVSLYFIGPGKYSLDARL